MESSPDALLQKVDDLIDLLRTHEEHEKLRPLLEDLEALHNRLVTAPDLEAESEGQPGDIGPVG